MNRPALNPFICGKPVPIRRFVGRRSEVDRVFGRLCNGESTAIVGEPHIGKTSMLKYIADESTRPEGIAQIFARYAFADFDCHLVAGTDCQPAQFWQYYVLPRVAEQIEDEIVRRRCSAVAEKGFNAVQLLESLQTDWPARLSGRAPAR